MDCFDHFHYRLNNTDCYLRVIFVFMQHDLKIVMLNYQLQSKHSLILFLLIIHLHIIFVIFHINFNFLKNNDDDAQGIELI